MTGVGRGSVLSVEMSHFLTIHKILWQFFTVFYLSNNVIDAKTLGYKTFVVRDAIHADTTDENDNGVLDSSALLHEKYKCPADWNQCPISGNCFQNDKACDGFKYCNDGFDEDPKAIIKSCCDEIIVSGMDIESGLVHQKYMGIYQKIECSR